MKQLLSLYPKLATLFANAVLFFLLLNVAAYFFPGFGKKIHEDIMTAPQALLKTNPELMQKVHEGKSLEDIAALYHDNPNSTSHPVLEFKAVPCSGKFYKVGFENCRYDSFITPSNVQQLIDHNTWLLGGSTTFGYGVAGDETISYFLNKFDSAHHYINFGALGYHQGMEMQKLILLLQKGYRPSRVIFLDGLNDLTQLTASNYEPCETPNRTYNAYSQDFGIANLGINKNATYAFPIVKLYYEYKAHQRIKSGDTGIEAPENVYDEKALYNTNPYLHFRITQSNEVKDTGLLFSKVDKYYKANLTLLEALSKAYNFEYTVFFQPIGMLLDSNDFITDLPRYQKEFVRYQTINAMYHHVLHGIRNNEFNHFYDLSKAHSECEYPYVDFTHYSKSLNQILARQILSNVSTTNSP